jgi:hypothetical protein
MPTLLTPEVVTNVLASVPDAWLGTTAEEAAAMRRAYETYFLTRLEAPRRFIEEAARAR